MTIEPDRSSQSFENPNQAEDDVNIAEKLAQWRLTQMGASIPSVVPQVSIFDVEERRGRVIVKAGLSRDVTFDYPIREPLDVTVVSTAANPVIAILARELFMSVVGNEIWGEPFREQAPDISQEYQKDRARVFARLADIDRLDLVAAGRLMSGLPGVNISRKKL